MSRGSPYWPYFSILKPLSKIEMLFLLWKDIFISKSKHSSSHVYTSKCTRCNLNGLDVRVCQSCVTWITKKRNSIFTYYCNCDFSLVSWSFNPWKSHWLVRRDLIVDKNEIRFKINVTIHSWGAIRLCHVDHTFCVTWITIGFIKM